MRILVVGCGSIGRRHIRLLREMGVEVVAWDKNIETQRMVSKEFGAINWLDCPGASDKDHIEWIQVYCKCDGAIIATPTNSHWADWYSIHRKFSVPMLVEKPLAVALDDAVDMAETTQELGIPLLVGYCLRFHPGLRRVKTLLEEGAIGTVRHASIRFGSYLPDWRPGADYRQNYAATQAHGGGILLDASHELDYARWLFGRPVSVSCTLRNSGALEIETEDIADLIVTFESGLQANIHLDYLRRDYDRGCTIIGDEDTMDLDIGPDYWNVTMNRRGAGAGHSFNRDDMYREELVHFIQCINDEATPLVTAQDGLEVLRLVDAAKRSARDRKVVPLDVCCSSR